MAKQRQIPEASHPRVHSTQASKKSPVKNAYLTRLLLAHSSDVYNTCHCDATRYVALVMGQPPLENRGQQRKICPCLLQMARPLIYCLRAGCQ